MKENRGRKESEKRKQKKEEKGERSKGSPSPNYFTHTPVSVF